MHAAPKEHLTTPSPLGVIAGSGELPLKILLACQARGRSVHIIAIEQETDPKIVEGFPHIWIKLGAIGTALESLKAANVTELVLAGKINRPKLSSLLPDKTGARLIKKLGLSLLGGDIAIFKTIVSFLEEEGFMIIGVQDIIAESLAPEGIIGTLAPDDAALHDIAQAREILQAIGQFDIGQSIIVKHGLVLGIEAAEGTDALILRAASLASEGKGGVLVKARKHYQEERVDLPTIGEATVTLVAQAGLAGIALEAGHSLIVDTTVTAAKADAAGLFLYGFKSLV